MAVTFVSIERIKLLYKNSERDFRKIKCSAVFDNLTLSGCDFSESDLSFSSFRSTNLSGCNFTKANVEWSAFQHANLSGCDFTKANGSYCNYSDANLKNSILTNADMSWSFFFNAIKNWKDAKGAMFEMSAFHESEVRPEAVKQAQARMISLKGFIDEETLARLSFIMHGNVEMADKANAEENKASYNVKFGDNYDFKPGGGDAYRVQPGSGYTATSTHSGTSPDSPYKGKKGKKTPYDK